MPNEDAFGTTLFNVNFWDASSSNTAILNSILDSTHSFPNNG